MAGVPRLTVHSGLPWLALRFDVGNVMVQEVGAPSFRTAVEISPDVSSRPRKPRGRS